MGLRLIRVLMIRLEVGLIGVGMMRLIFYSSSRAGVGSCVPSQTRASSKRLVRVFFGLFHLFVYSFIQKLISALLVTTNLNLTASINPYLSAPYNLNNLSLNAANNPNLDACRS